MAAVEIAGIKKLKIYNTANTKMEFKHPNYYKNLRKLYRSRNRDQAISGALDGAVQRAPGTGLRGQAKVLPKIQSKKLVDKLTSEQADKPSSSQAGEGGRVGPKGSSSQAREQASAQASSGARINKRWI